MSALCPPTASPLANRARPVRPRQTPAARAIARAWRHWFSAPPADPRTLALSAALDPAELERRMQHWDARATERLHWLALTL